MPIDTGDTTWMLISTGLVMLMTPALGFFEAGLIRSKNSLSILMQTFSGLAILSTLWFVLGFTLVFAPSQNGWIGGLDWLFFNNVPFNDSVDYAPTIPGVTFGSYQMMFAVITPLLITGAFAERLKWSSFFVFIIAWSIFIYYPLAHWIWGRGWLADLGVFDFAGGIVIHTSAGMASLAAALVLGRRKNFGPDIMVPHNIPLAVIGAALLWIGWFGFNAGSALASGSLAANTLLVTHIASATSAMVWIFLSWKRSGKPSTTAVINGAIAGLAGVTPAAGFIDAQSSFILGIVLGFASYYAILLLKEHWKIDDALDVSSVHGVTGIVGSLAIGILATQVVNPAGPNGLLFGNPMQFAIQALGVGVAGALGFGGTVVIMKVIDKTIGLKVKEEEEDIGLDITQHAERAYVT
ncbi:ammonium transporter [Candidatus Nitrososphaera evergladensis SR1]|jgi:Amt family ammonium transporter|uniref:Ammonium transporter n=1 Tax=Candidatus Nitrososphaera evergladensis SR1 TaxID=1459636 RepID=A0A075N138_9ARCH|nr:ammonium transporter [Candidatus Nitrososphaera evergladensis]AIF85194.1 ammonium transporter [Candidatus Nitrososphaera evergladensis SR1]